jgi:hypothetical protein
MSVTSATIATFNERNTMPNWVNNTLTIQGPKSEIDSIKERLNRPYKVLHDSWSMETNKMEVTESVYSNPVFAFWNIHSPLEDGITMDEYIQQPTRLGTDTSAPDWFAKEVAHAKTQKDWYSWNTTNWGTKWDVGVGDGDTYPDTELLEYESNGDDNWLVYKYNTAWSPAVTILTKLSNLVPNSLLTLEFEEETGWGGEYEIVRGEVKEILEYSNMCYPCGSYDTMDYCDNECGEFCSSCNEGSWKDETAMAECQTHKIYLTTTETKGN